MRAAFEVSKQSSPEGTASIVSGRWDEELLS
jgi:hypothetical protein